MEFLVSFVVPYYVVYAMSCVYLPEPVDLLDHETEIAFDFSPDERPFALAVTKEIERTFAGFEPMPPEVGKTIVPEVIGGGELYGQSTLYGCSFSDKW